MTFKHIDKLKKEMPFVKQLDREDGHYYEDDKGNVYPSITTIKNLTDPKTWYPFWINKIMRDNNVGAIEANKIAIKISKGSTDVGTALHELAENYLNNNLIIVSDPENFEKDPNLLFVPLRQWLDEHVDNIYATESKMFSKQLQLAGTVDFVAVVDGVLSICDFKNSRKPKMPSEIKRSKYYEQICAYGKMFEECYGIHVEQGVIIVISWDGKVRPFTVKLEDYDSNLLDMIIKYESEVNF